MIMICVFNTFIPNAWHRDLIFVSSPIWLVKRVQGFEGLRIQALFSNDFIITNNIF